MTERTIIGPGNNLIDAVADRLLVDGNDFSDAAVIFPGKRPAHFLRKELARRIGHSLIPPKIFSIDEFVKSMYQSIYPEPVKDLEPIDAVTLLFQVHNELKERIGGSYFASLDAFIPIGLKLFAEIEELRLAELPERRLRETLSSLTYNRLFSLPEYYYRFYSLVEKNKYSTRALRYSKVAGRIHEINLEIYSKLIITGLFKLTNAEKIIVGELEKRPNIFFIYQTDKPEEGPSRPEIHFIKAPDTHGQVFALSALIKKQIDKKQRLDERSVVVLPTADALFPLVHQTLSLLPAEEYNIALGYPVVRTPIYGFLHNLMELICTKQGNLYSVMHYIKFILHPYTKNIRFGHRTDVTRILFHAIESMLVENVPKSLIKLEEVEKSDEIFTNIANTLSESGTEIKADDLKEHLKKIHSQTIRTLEHIDTLKEYARKNIEVLNYIYEQSTAQMHPLFRPYAEAIMEIFSGLDKSLAGTVSFSKIESYFNFLQRYFALQDVPFTGTPLRGLQVLGLLETRGLHFDNVYLLDANDNVLPGGMGNDMLLPQQLRTSLGLETRHDRDALSEYYFNLLVRSAKRVYIFFKESGESDKSRFVERLLWERQKQDKKYTYETYIEAVQYNVKLAGDTISSINKSQDIVNVLNGFTYSASALDRYLRCPIQFYYCNVMRLEEKEEAGTDLDNKAIGLFVHEVLKKYYEPFLGVKLEMHKLDDKRMANLVDELFEQKFGKDNTGPIYLVKRQIKKQLLAMLNDYQRKILESGDVILNGLEENVSVQALGSRFKGRIDRIEQRGDKTMIIDYKTGAIPDVPSVNFKKLDLEKRESWNEAVTSLQLPVYLLLYSVNMKIPPERIIPAYLYLGESRLGAGSEVVFVEDESSYAGCFKQMQRLIEKIIDEIQDTAVPFSPPPDLSKACPFCPYTVLCGTQWVRGRKV